VSEVTKVYAYLQKSPIARPPSLQTIYAQAWVDIEKPLKNVILGPRYVYIAEVGT
jgi:hypothetical protein